MRIHNANCQAAMFAVLCLAATLLAEAAHADITYTVNSTLDQIDDDVLDGVCHTVANTCTLRAAVMQANRDSAPAVTIVLPAGVYMLTRPATGTDDELNGDLDFTTSAAGNPPISLQGAGAATTIIDANQIDRVIEVTGARTLLISGVTIRNGLASGPGGGILVGSTSVVTITACEIEANTSNDRGGGLAIQGIGSVKQSVVTLNQASSGGGLYVGGNASVLQSAIVENASILGGGGIHLSGRMLMSNSTISGNSTEGYGGGMYVYFTASNWPMEIYNTTIAFNYADSNADSIGNGGGLYIDFAAHPAGAFNLYNSIIVTNYIGATAQQDDCKGVVHTHAQNRFGDTSGCTIVQISGNWDFFYPLDSLDPLQDNGGPTPTVALLPGSNAIDAGNPSLGCLDNTSTTIAEDQRGFPRNVGICDLGAYEYGSIDPNLIFRDGFD